MQHKKHCNIMHIAVINFHDSKNINEYMTGIALSWQIFFVGKLPQTEEFMHYFACF